jgi:hypothetical protein
MADNLFANYEQDFRDVYSSLESHLRAIPNLSNGMSVVCVSFCGGHVVLIYLCVCVGVAEVGCCGG